MRFLINLDLEGINHVVGAPYQGLSGAPEQYQLACEQAVTEVNTVASALFDAGAEFVAFWDNHGGGGNVDPAKLDPRLHIYAKPETAGDRMNFTDELHLDGLFLIGYHAKEGTLGGVLAHTMSSVNYQYIRIGGHDVGEMAIDAYIASAKGYPLRFVSSDDKGVAEARAFLPGVRTVVTKTGLSRNEAIFRRDEEVKAEQYTQAKAAALDAPVLTPLAFPAILEVRYTRMERAAEALENLRTKYQIEAAYKGDAHTLTYMMHSIADLQHLLRS